MSAEDPYGEGNTPLNCPICNRTFTFLNRRRGRRSNNVHNDSMIISHILKCSSRDGTKRAKTRKSEGKGREKKAKSDISKNQRVTRQTKNDKNENDEISMQASTPTRDEQKPSAPVTRARPPDEVNTVARSRRATRSNTSSSSSTSSMSACKSPPSSRKLRSSRSSSSSPPPPPRDIVPGPITSMLVSTSNQENPKKMSSISKRKRVGTIIPPSQLVTRSSKKVKAPESSPPSPTLSQSKAKNTNRTIRKTASSTSKAAVTPIYTSSMRPSRKRKQDIPQTAVASLNPAETTSSELIMEATSKKRSRKVGKRSASSATRSCPLCKKVFPLATTSVNEINHHISRCYDANFPKNNSQKDLKSTSTTEEKKQSKLYADAIQANALEVNRRRTSVQFLRDDEGAKMALRGLFLK